jgi:hypothetical protein
VRMSPGRSAPSTSSTGMLEPLWWTYVGFGRIVASEIEAPNMLLNLV